ncbi:terpenoid synthase [Viridothelium virens]|uniref:Terpenoid synthase n=1 Tax=Viridothelium virens TaxID=1048519 RepID=A0A6A6H533_VIRVR|nr:terpenoid synthase [Viridothelium virens]
MKLHIPKAPMLTIGAFSSRPRIPRCPQCLHPFPSLQYAYYHPSRRRSQSAWAAAVSAAQNVFNNDPPPQASPISIDPIRTVAKEMKFLTGNIRQLLGSGHPTLDTVAKYYTQSEGKFIRPMLVLLMSQATASMSQTSRRNTDISSQGINTPLTPPSILFDVNPSAPDYDSTKYNPLTGPPTSADTTSTPDILPSQHRLAEITELIHTASLLHDDVLDTSLTRRSHPSANIAFGNKMAVLAGDFLLGRASVALARLRSPEVTELLATVIANLVEGEFMQLRNTPEPAASPASSSSSSSAAAAAFASASPNPVYSDAALDHYLQKTYLKSASLISKSCRAAAILGGAPMETVEASYSYGRNLGLAFQLVDDMLDYTSEGGELGKPAGADLELGLATAPLLFAWRESPRGELGELVGRRFGGEGDVARARELVAASDGIEQTRRLAQEYVDNAVRALNDFPASEAKDGLVEMCTKVMKRKK